MAKNSTKADWENFWSRDRSVEEIYPTSDSIILNLLKSVDVQGLRVLEVGAGTGRDSIKLSENNANVTVLDYADNALLGVRQALKHSESALNLVSGDGLILPFDDESFDIVFHQGLLEHFHDPQLLLRENIRVLKKGGYLLVDVPQKFHVYTLIKHVLIIFDKWFAGWETEFSIGALRKLFKKNNLIIKREYGDWMNPSLFYRMVREAAKPAGVNLPMYPKAIPVLSAVRRSCKTYLLKRKLSLYTFLTIGIIGQKL